MPKPGMAVYQACNPSLEREAGASQLSLRPVLGVQLGCKVRPCLKKKINTEIYFQTQNSPLEHSIQGQAHARTYGRPSPTPPLGGCLLS